MTRAWDNVSNPFLNAAYDIMRDNVIWTKQEETTFDKLPLRVSMRLILTTVMTRSLPNTKNRAAFMSAIMQDLPPYLTKTVSAPLKVTSQEPAVQNIPIPATTGVFLEAVVIPRDPKPYGTVPHKVKANDIKQAISNSMDGNTLRTPRVFHSPPPLYLGTHLADLFATDMMPPTMSISQPAVLVELLRSQQNAQGTEKKISQKCTAQVTASYAGDRKSNWNGPRRINCQHQSSTQLSLN